VLGFNEFAAQVVVRQPPYWGDVGPDALWTDHFETLTRSWFPDQDIPASQGDVGRAIQAAARKNGFHPLRTLLDDELEPQWDGQLRIDQWMITYLHAPDTPYARAIGRRFLISAVARIFDPGCKVDHMLVLEGPQGQGKSKAVRALAIRDEWYADRLSDPGSKDAAMETAGAWLIEVAEMHALHRATASASKASLTRQSERYRPPHGKHLTKHRRQCVFVGTINPPGTGYLEDSTGSRRIWPVECQGIIDIEGLIRDRNQLWAEAVVRYKAGDVWWLETPELEALATAESRRLARAH
jgi:predicted P-loop ATPase